MSESDSVYLDCVASDGRSGFITRLQVDHDLEKASVWLHLFQADRAIAFNLEALPLSGDPGLRHAAVTGDYQLAGDPAAHFVRTGSASAPKAASVAVSCLAHDSASAPSQPGDLRVELSAQFTPAAMHGSNLAGRSETLGSTTAAVRVGDSVWRVEGLGQFHEQHQTAPRFKKPFTYGTLRGQDCGLVFIVGSRGSTGFLARNGETENVAGLTIDAVGPERRVTVTPASGGELTMALERTHHYLLPIGGHDRESSVVIARATGLPQMTGCVNDWAPS